MLLSGRTEKFDERSRLHDAARRSTIARFPVLAKSSHRFAQTHRQRGDGLQSLLSAIGQVAIICSADLGEQQLRVAQDSRQRIV